MVASAGDEEERLKELMAQLKDLTKGKMDIQAIEFEKDDSTNFHIDFIHATA